MDHDPRSTRGRLEAIRTRADRSLEEAVEAERLRKARAEGSAGDELKRLKRSSQAAVAFAHKVLGKRA